MFILTKWLVGITLYRSGCFWGLDIEYNWHHDANYIDFIKWYGIDFRGSGRLNDDEIALEKPFPFIDSVSVV
jgi:hypothetical protein